MTMQPLSLFCKSYNTDLLRLVRLARSVQLFNVEGLPFYVTVPQGDFALFREHLAGLNVHLMADDDILCASPRIDATKVTQMPGSLSQQVVKSEFWRLGLSQTYLCLDSDAVFIRSFGREDFMTDDGTPYTIMDEAHDLLEDALRQDRKRVVTAFNHEADLVQSLFGRMGRRYSFGPFPLIWHRDVWESLDKRWLQPRGMSFANAIELAPIESRWYGEALLAFQAVALRPSQALFKVYHYAWQFDKDRRLGLDELTLSTLYSGVIYQSAWDREMDWPHEGGHLLSRTGRRIRRMLGRI
jgi:Family of unknown function (DUF6492)